MPWHAIADAFLLLWFLQTFVPRVWKAYQGSRPNPPRGTSD